MNMKVSLQLKLGQQLTMTPQLQQAIRLLQLSTLDLQNEIQEALESNPMLELQDDNNESGNTGDKQETPDNSQQTNEQDFSAQGDTSQANSTETEASAGSDTVTSEDEWSNTIPEDLPVDTAWDDIYTNNAPSGPAPEDDNNAFEQRNSATESLADHLDWQLNLTPMSDRDRFIAMSLIDATDLSLIHI